MLYPPSPALSLCDSLDGIDDLDAYLASQGSLSHFPTPPLKKTPIVQTVEVSADESESDQDVSLSRASIRSSTSPLPQAAIHIATVLAEEASIDVDYSPDDIEAIRNIVKLADLPMEILALGFNILAGLHARFMGLGVFADTPPDLLIVAALSLAVSLTNDHPPRTFWWSRHVCDCTWTVRRIDKTILKVFAVLDFKLHEYSANDKIAETAHRLSLPEPEPVFFDTQTTSDSPQTTLEKQPLRLLIDGASNAFWQYGQLTPDATPPPSAHLKNNLGLRMPLRRFLPVL